MTKISLALFGIVAFAAPCLAQTTYRTAPVAPYDEPETTGTIIRGQNNTGNDLNVTVPYGATGADTLQTDSAVGGNANQPALAVPQGSGGGASGGNN